MALASLKLDSAATLTLAATSVVPVLLGPVTGTGDAVATMVSLTDLATFFIGVDGPFFMTTATATPSAFVATSFDGFSSTVSGAAVMGFGTTNDVTLMNRAGTAVLGVTANTANVTVAGQFDFVTKAVSTTALATPSALAATALNAFASTVSGATLMGFGTTGDVTLKNRAGTDVLVVTSNTTGVTMAGALAMVGALSGVTTAVASTSLTVGAPGATLINRGGAEAAATTASSIIKVVTGIADNTATTVLTITVPNAAHGALIQVTVVGYAGASGAIGAFEDVTGVTYNIAVARTAGVAMGATASTAFGSAAAVVVGAGTMTCVAALTLNGEGVGSTNTASFKVTIDQSSTSSAHRCMVYATILNSQASGITLT